MTTHTAHTPAIGQSAHVEPQASTEAVERDSVVMAVNADDHTVPIAVQNQLPRSANGNTANNGIRTRPEKFRPTRSNSNFQIICIATRVQFTWVGKFARRHAGKGKLNQPLLVPIYHN